MGVYPLLLEKPIHGNDLSSEYLTFYEWHSDSDQRMSEFGDWWASPHNTIGNQTEIAEVDPPSPLQYVHLHGHIYQM